MCWWIPRMWGFMSLMTVYHCTVRTVGPSLLRRYYDTTTTLLRHYYDITTTTLNFVFRVLCIARKDFMVLQRFNAKIAISRMTAQDVVSCRVEKKQYLGLVPTTGHTCLGILWDLYCVYWCIYRSLLLFDMIRIDQMQTNLSKCKGFYPSFTFLFNLNIPLESKGREGIQ